MRGFLHILPSRHEHLEHVNSATQDRDSLTRYDMLDIMRSTQNDFGTFHHSPGLRRDPILAQFFLIIWESQEVINSLES